MPRSLRSSTLARIACLSAAAAAVVLGCAAGDADETVGTSDGDPASDGGSRDARATDGSLVMPEAGSRAADASTTDASDAGRADAGDAGDAARVDGGREGGVADAGDAGDADPGDAGTGLAPAQGDVVISEVMYNPSGTELDEEWIEIHNTTAEPRRLGGLVLRDGANPVHQHTLRAGLVVAPGAYVVLASNRAGAVAAQVPDGVIVYDYNTGEADKIALGNSGSGSIVLLDGATEIARAKYGALGIGNAANGQSIQLGVLTYAGAGVAASWCKSSNAWVAGADKGTPGAASDCP